jgi:hypothetical protein
MNRLNPEVFEETRASWLEQLRDKARQKRRIIYDCFGAEVLEDHTVRCRFGTPFPDNSNGTTQLLAILRGRTPQVCQKCSNYDDGGEPGG